LRVFENRVLRRIFGGRKWQGAGEDYIFSTFINYALRKTLLGR